MKTVQLTDNEWKALLEFMEILGDYQSNAGCNDLPEQLCKLFNKEEGKRMAEQFAIFNNPDAPEGPDWPVSDFCLLALIKHKIKRQL